MIRAASAAQAAAFVLAVAFVLPAPIAAGEAQSPGPKPPEQKAQDKKPEAGKGGADVKVTTKAFRRNPNDGEIFYFWGAIYVAGWMEFRDPEGAFDPSFCYSRAPSDVSGMLTWRSDKPQISMGFTCRKFVQRNGSQASKVLGDWLLGNYSPLITLEVRGLTPCDPPPSPPDPKTGKPGKKPSGMWAKLDATLRIDSVETTFEPLAQYELSYDRMNELTGIRFNITGTMKGKDIGLRTALADKDVKFTFSTACYTEKLILLESKKPSLSEAGVKDVPPPLPPRPDRARLDAMARGAEFGDPSADEKAKQERFTQQYFTSMDVAARAQAVELLQGCTHPSTRQLLAQVCYMERDVDLNLRAYRMLGAMPTTDSSLAEMLAGAFEVSPPQRRSEYAEIAARSEFRFDLCNAFVKWLQRARFPKARAEPKLKPGQQPPPKTPKELEEEAQRAAYLKVVEALNALGGTTFEPGMDGRQIKEWWDGAWEGIYQADVELQRRKSAGTAR